MENKNNQTTVTGSDNIVIQDISSSNITVNINGKEQKLEIAMNQWLVQNVMTNIAGYDKIAQKFVNAVANIENWQNQTKYRTAGLTILQSSYVGIVGIYLNKLSAISTGKSSIEEKIKELIRNSYYLALRLLDLVDILLLSKLWDFSQNKKAKISDKNKEIISQFFSQSVERDIKFSYDLLIALFDTFKSNNIEYPIEELEKITTSVSTTSDLYKSFLKIEENYIQLQKQEPTGEESFWTEKSLTDILVQFNFLAKYKIQAVKEIDYHHIRSLQEFFIHKLSFYGLSSKRTEQEKHVSENVNYTTKKIFTNSVILYETDYFEGFNLFPFIIDYNNIFLEKGTNICVFSHKDLAEEKLMNFISVADNQYLGVEANDEKLSENFSEIYSDKDTITQHNKNIIVQLINEAHTSIVGKEESADDFLDSLLD